jgi:hypothetical protein
MELTWTRRPGVVVVDSRLVGKGAPVPYTLALPRRGRQVFEDLANLRTDQEVSRFTAQWGRLTEDPRYAWASAIRDEAEILRACLGIWEGTQRPGYLRDWQRHSGGVHTLREITLGADDEWRGRWQQIKTRAPGRATAIASAWLWWALRRGLAGLRLVPVKEGPVDAPWLWEPFGPWRWRLEVPDLLTFCYLEMATAMTQGRLPSWCPYCGRVYLVQKEGRQETCGKNRCRQAAHRTKVRLQHRKGRTKRNPKRRILGKTAPRRLSQVSRGP